MKHTNMKLTYINDEQIIDEGAKALIREHLGWINSTDGMPSEYTYSLRVCTAIADAYIAANYTDDEWFYMGALRREAAEGVANELADRAAEEADKRWAAVMTLLGLGE